MGYASQTFAKFAIITSVRLGIRVAAIAFTKLHGKVTHESISRIMKEWQKLIK